MIETKVHLDSNDDYTVFKIDGMEFNTNITKTVNMEWYKNKMLGADKIFIQVDGGSLVTISKVAFMQIVKQFLSENPLGKALYGDINE